MDVVGVEEASQLLIALRKYKDEEYKIKNVLILCKRVTESRQTLQDAVDDANRISGGVFAAAVVGTSRRTDGSNMGKKRRMKEKWRKGMESESASIHHPSSHTDLSKKLRLDDE